MDWSHPVQRVCKYPLLLKELLKYCSPEDSQRTSLETAFQKIASVVSIIDQRKEYFENLQRVRELTQELEGAEVLSAILLIIESVTRSTQSPIVTRGNSQRVSQREELSYACESFCVQRYVSFRQTNRFSLEKKSSSISIPFLLSSNESDSDRRKQ